MFTLLPGVKTGPSHPAAEPTASPAVIPTANIIFIMNTSVNFLSFICPFSLVYVLIARRRLVAFRFSPERCSSARTRPGTRKKWLRQPVRVSVPTADTSSSPCSRCLTPEAGEATGLRHTLANLGNRSVPSRARVVSPWGLWAQASSGVGIAAATDFEPSRAISALPLQPFAPINALT